MLGLTGERVRYRAGGRRKKGLERREASRKGQRRSAVRGRSGYRKVCGTRGYSSLSGLHPGKLCMEMPPLNNPPPLTSAQQSSHYVASESTDGAESLPALGVADITVPFSDPLLPLPSSLFHFFFFGLSVPFPFHISACYLSTSIAILYIYARHVGENDSGLTRVIGNNYSRSSQIQFLSRT